MIAGTVKSDPPRGFIKKKQCLFYLEIQIEQKIFYSRIFQFNSIKFNLIQDLNERRISRDIDVCTIIDTFAGLVPNYFYKLSADRCINCCCCCFCF